jgi:hypothetical protein
MPTSTILIRFLNGPKLDCFIIKNFLTYYKTVKASGPFEKRTKMSGFYNGYPNTKPFENRTNLSGIRMSMNIGPFDNRSQIKHPITGLVRFSDHYCNFKQFFSFLQPLIFMLFLMVDIVRLDYVLQLPLDLWAIYH